AALNADIQAQRIATGHLKTDDHSTTGRDGLDIFAGDTVMTRSNNPDLGVANRESFRVVQVHSDGGLILAGEDQRHHHITPDYVRDHIHLGYAVTDYGNQGTTVDHGSVLLESSMSGGGVYVGATRGREDKNIHIVADDLENAKAQFIASMTRDRGDRGLDQARTDLAAQLPQHTLAVHPRIRGYIDNVSQRLTTLEKEMRRLQPLAAYRAQAQAFQQRHETTATQAGGEAERAQQSAAEKAAELKTAREQLHRQSLGQLRSEIKHDLAQLQAKEQRARDAGFFKRAKAKHDARTHRAALEDRYGVALPGTDDERFKHPMRGYDYEWAHNVAQQQAQTHRPTDETVDQLHEEVEQLRSQARRATERAESLQSAWDTHVGPAPTIEGKGTSRDYEKAQQLHAKIQKAIARASNPAHHDDLLDFLDKQAQEKKQKKAQRQQPRPKPQKSPDRSATTYLQQQRLQQHQPDRDGLER